MSKLTDEPRVVFDRSHSCSEQHGPSEFGRIGFAIGAETFWVGSYFYPGTPSTHYAEKVAFAQAVVDRWNASLPTAGDGKGGVE